MSKPKKGHFSCTYEPGPVFVSPKAYEKLLEQAGKHIEFVDANGPPDGCKCPYCDDARKAEFKEIYGEDAR